MIFLSIFLVIAGLLMLVQPKLIWSLTESWKSQGAEEPTSLYTASIRLGGVLCTLIGLASAVVYWMGLA